MASTAMGRRAVTAVTTVTAVTAVTPFGTMPSRSAGTTTDAQPHSLVQGTAQAFRGRGAWSQQALRASTSSAVPDPAGLPTGQRGDHFSFEVVHQSKKSAARVGRIHTPHGTVTTPAFVAVGTGAALKGITAAQAEEAGLDLMFANTYHLLLQPGAEAVEAAGGVHRFMGRKKPIITDSGGFQIFSLNHGTVFDEMHLKRRTQRKGSGASSESGWVEKVSEEGVVFRSYRDGSKMLLTPETCVAAQKAIGADIILPLDELPPYHVDRARLVASAELSHRWMERSLRAHLSDSRQQAMYGIIHGGSDRELRQHSADFVSALPFDGFAMGGTLGKDREEMVSLMSPILPHLPPSKPRHILGVADDRTYTTMVSLGADTFDSCYPTRDFDRPVDTQCSCPTCTNHSVGYLNHLIRAKEPLAGVLLSLHNLHFMCVAMRRTREAILADEL